MPRLKVLPLVAAIALGGCDVQTLWGGESSTTQARREAAAAARAAVPVQAVQSVEIGRTRDGFLLTAYATTAAPGYARPTLQPRRGGAPGIDGYVEYDFVATEPDPALPMVTAGAPRQLRADLPVSANTLRGAAGLRVMGLTGGAQLDFAPVPPPQPAG